MFKNSLTKNARAVITGAGSGIGKALALELARRGSLVVCTDINLDAAEQTASEVRRLGGQAWAVACDVSKLEQVQALADKADELLPEPVNLVINNAGVGVGGKTIGETSIEDWEWTVNINLWGVVYGCHVFAPRLRLQEQAGIINVASTASFSAAPLMGPYNATKAAALAISETLAAELSGTGVSVTALCPTLVKTNISANGRIQGESNDLFNRLMDRIGMSADKVARMALDGLDNKQLYVMPQVDARMIWRIKRLLPNSYAAITGLINRRMTSKFV
ncbi:SDR family NAD(P)-dependent oxidoreductase [Marinobacter shengliensis]|uniref:SDR family NAD(P)-dependent oxidoreductase n=1 Tax=Marinobacter shengliensis TaxID=1389223 RepID=UPI000D10B7AB|nr:SDR family NAD(P)-dependent oxidoreductase [Marinobacter shengliensis]PSF14184.1 short-chain dehydrogenase [Marinobacter shengliensis]